MRPCLATDFKRVAKALGRDQRGRRTAAFDDHIGRNRCPVTQIGQIGECDAQRLDHLRKADADSNGWIVGRRRNLVEMNFSALCVEQRQICECAADIRSEEHTSELQSLMRTSYAVFCLDKKKETNTK